jgi:hypothetical protein
MYYVIYAYDRWAQDTGVPIPCPTMSDVLVVLEQASTDCLVSDPDTGEIYWAKVDGVISDRVEEA